MLSLFRSLLVVCALCPLLSVSAFFALNSPKLVIERLDPIVNPNGIAAHLHTVLGGSNWSDNYNYTDLINSDCTTMPVSVDKSNYWSPTLYYVHPDQQKFEVVPLGFGRIYYLSRPGPNKKEKIVAFPPGFRMVAGDMNRRTYNPTKREDTAITFVCLDYYNSHTGDPEWEQRNDFFTKHNCPNGMRMQFAFPACWDGKRLFAEDGSHMAYTIQNNDGGDCPDSHPVHFVNLFFEFIYETNLFPINPTGVTWALSNGDTTGYGFHGDFTNGWDQKVLQAALDQCDDAGGDPARCAPFAPYMQNAEFCKPSKNILNEKVGLKGEAISYLPGCNKLWFGTGPKPTCDANWEGSKTKPTYEPAKSVLPTNWVRLGCYAGATTGDPLTGAMAEFKTDNSGAKCAAFCESKGFALAATTYSYVCRCGSKMTNGASLAVEASASMCDTECPGRYTETCGGGNNRHLQVMFNPTLRPVVPSTAALNNSFYRDGCVVSQTNNVRLFTAVDLRAPDMTPAKCVDFCFNQSQNKKGSYPYAGTEYGTECYCSATLPSNTVRAPDSECSMSCGGASGLICGGGSRMSLYTRRPTWVVAAQNATALPKSWKPLGCFNLGADALGKLTASRAFMDPAMTNGMCAARCASSKASYAVVQYGTQCFCGSADSIAAVTKDSMQLPAAQCDAECGGAVLERCGGLQTSNVMLTGQPGAGAPAVVPTPASGATGTAGPTKPVEAKRVIRIRIRKPLAKLQCQDLYTLRDIVAKMLGVPNDKTGNRVDVQIDGGIRCDTLNSGGAYRRLLADEDYVDLLVILYPAGNIAYTDATPVTAMELETAFQAQYKLADSPLRLALATNGVDTTFTPEAVTSNDAGASSSSGAGADPAGGDLSDTSSSLSSSLSIIIGCVVGVVLLGAAY